MRISAFVKLKIILCSRELALELRVRVLKCYFSTIIRTRKLKQEQIHKLPSFETWCCRRMLRISWAQRKTMEVLREMGKQCEVINTKTRKLQYLGHIMRRQRYRMFRLIIQGKTRGGSIIGRRRDLRDLFKCSSLKLFRAEANRVWIAMIISNALRRWHLKKKKNFDESFKCTFWFILCIRTKRNNIFNCSFESLGFEW